MQRNGGRFQAPRLFLIPKSAPRILERNAAQPTTPHALHSAQGSCTIETGSVWGGLPHLNQWLRTNGLYRVSRQRHFGLPLALPILFQLPRRRKEMHKKRMAIGALVLALTMSVSCSRLGQPSDDAI